MIINSWSVSSSVHDTWDAGATGATFLRGFSSRSRVPSRVLPRMRRGTESAYPCSSPCVIQVRSHEPSRAWPTRALGSASCLADLAVWGCERFGWPDLFVCAQVSVLHARAQCSTFTRALSGSFASRALARWRLSGGLPRLPVGLGWMQRGFACPVSHHRGVCPADLFLECVPGSSSRLSDQFARFPFAYVAPGRCRFPTLRCFPWMFWSVRKISFCMCCSGWEAHSGKASGMLLDHVSSSVILGDGAGLPYGSASVMGRRCEWLVIFLLRTRQPGVG